MPGRNTIITVGAVIAVLLAIPGFFIGLYGVVGILSGNKLIGGALGTLWGYGVVAGTYELIRRKFDMDKWRKYSDQHLLAGTIAVSAGMIVSGAIHETMPALALVSALSAIIQANDGHDNKVWAWIHVAVLGTGIAIGTWIYNNSWVGSALLQRIESLP